jgi:hypothetical protein
MSDRSVLYFELFEWLEVNRTQSCTLADYQYFFLDDLKSRSPGSQLFPFYVSSVCTPDHTCLQSMMAMPIFIISSVKSVTTKKVPARGKPTVREREIVYEGSSGPRELLESIVIQAQAALKGLEGVKVPEKAKEELTEDQKRMTNDIKGKAKEASATPSDENLKLLNFCRRILATANGIDRALQETKGVDFVQRLHASLPKIFTSALESEEIFVQPGATDDALLKAYIDWATRVRFEYCDLSVPTEKDGRTEDDIPQYKFYYNNEARMLANSDIPKRSLAIAKEVRSHNLHASIPDTSVSYSLLF